MTGILAGSLPHLQVTELEYRMGETTSVKMTLPYNNAPSNWLTLTTPYTHAIVMCVDETPYWGGIILSRTRELGGSGVELTVATPEHFLDQIYVTDQVFNQVSQTEIIRQLIDTNLANKFFAYTLDIGESTILRDRSYTEDSDKTVLHYIQNLMEVKDGPDFCHRWVWTDDRTGIVPQFQAADHIGVTVPSTIFDETSITGFSLLEDYTSGYGAVRVLAYGMSTDSDSTRPSSGWLQAQQSTRPLVEYKYCPGSSIVEEATLLEYAESTLQSLANGTTTADFTMSLLDAPQVWSEWRPGDVLGWKVNEPSGQFPDLSNALISARVVGYSLSFSGAWNLTCIVQSQSSVLLAETSEEEVE